MHHREDELALLHRVQEGRNRAAVRRPRLRELAAALAGGIWGWSNESIPDHRVREAGLDPGDRTLRLTLDLAAAKGGVAANRCGARRQIAEQT